MSTIFDHRPHPYTIIDDIVFECDLSSLQKMTLITLFKFAGKQSTAWPGVETLARCTSSSARQVRRVLNDLQELDLLRIERRRGQSSIYHIPEYRISKNRLCSVWDDSTPDTMSPKQSHLTVSKKKSLSDQQKKSPSPASEKPCAQANKSDNNEREKFEYELIKPWSNHFSIQHKPDSLKEQTAMDWMLFASRNNQLYQIKFPVAYLKTNYPQRPFSRLYSFSDAAIIYCNANTSQANSSGKMGLY